MASIKYLAEKIKPFYIPLLMLVIASIFFGLGRLSALEEQHGSIQIYNSPNEETASVVQGVNQAQVSVSSQVTTQSGEVIGSKTSKKYYFPWCGTVKRIKIENQVHFDSISDAQNAGYRAGGNCKGLQ